ncbi:hypothetical protein GCM10023185_03300 [Hymenobacter saemangeumensis]|uniref:DUF11 domain-containing protein n=2 Tax=Hymenobacter saemangeumensis TaxID=1084522 RepID=A0ABP8HZ30_9BACT
MLLSLLAAPSAWAGIGVQRVQNGNFSRYPITSGTAYTIAPGTDLGAWRSGATYVNTGTRPGLGQVSIQRAAINYTAAGTIATQQSTFPGDAANGVTASSTYLLYRGTASTAIWYQTASVRPGTTYVFSFYASNANAPGTTTTPVPVLQFQLNGVAQGTNATLANEAVNDVWTRYSYTFTTAAGQTSVELRLVDLTNAGSVTSDQVALTSLSLRAPFADAGPSYSCDGSFYQARQVDTAPANGTLGNSTRLFEVIRNSTPYTTSELQDLGGTFNAVGYNSLDGYMYALTYTGNVNPTGTNPQVDRATDATSVVELVKIGTTGIESLGTVSGLPVDQWAAGSFDRSGNLYVKNQTGSSVIYRINLASMPLTATALNTVNSGGGAASFTIFDLAFNPIDNLLYGTSFPGALFIINPTTGLVTQIGASSDNNQPLGSAFFDITGNLFAYGNGPSGSITATSGRFYVINKTTGAASVINNINGATNSDGASCINPLQRIDVVKTVTSVVPVSATQYDITYVVQVKNTGTISDPNVQVSDLLRGNANNTTFPTSTGVTLQSISVQNFEGATLAANTGFTGVSGGASLLTGDQALSPNQRATITFTVRVTFPSGSVPTTAQNNTAYATSTSTGPNAGYTQLGDGTLLTPFDLVANDASTNSGVLPPNRTTTTDNGDTPSPTPVTFAPAIFGNVFEDVNYGGGASRDLPTSQGVSRSGARVELYSNTGAFISATTTDASGNYSFTGLTTGATYTVRVVNSTVTSSRPGYVAGLLPVQTFVNGDVNRVGGENPLRSDAGSNTTSATLASLTTASTVAQSISTVTLSATSASPVVNVNFGYNFNTVVNTNNTGQGSLRQFILNSNALGGEASLAQAGSDASGPLPAGVETSIFMISNGTAVPGLRAGLTNQLSAAGVAVITPATALPAITGPNTAINGSTQTANVGNTNNVTLGAGGTVGTAGTALGTVNGPEVQIVGTSAIGIGIDIAAGGTGTQVLGLAIYGFGTTGDNNNSAEIRVAAGGVTISRNLIGTTATSFTDPGAGVRGVSDGIRFTAGTTASTVSNNLIGFNSGKGISTNSGVTNITITNNEIRSNALANSAWDGIDIQGSATTVTNNLVINNTGVGVDSYLSAGSITIQGNTIVGNGRGSSTLAPNETAGIRIYGTNNTVSQNVVSGNYGAGVQVQGNTATTLISQNSIFNNGNVTAANGAAASGQIGIDLNTGAEGTGTAPFVTLNSGSTAGPNGLLNYPVLTSATVQGTNLVVRGFARPNTAIELFIAQPNPAGVNATGANFGQGQTYLGTFTEGSAADMDPRTGLSYSGPINGFNQGSDTNAYGFAFIIPLSSLPGGTISPGTLLTSTATLANVTSEFSGNVSVNTAPVPNSVTNVAIPNTNGATVLNPNLSATVTGTGNSVQFYSITALPASGTLTYNGTVLTAANIGTIQILPSLLNTLTYTPVAGFTGGSVSFSYTATDANGISSVSNNTGGTITSGPATYTIPVLQVADVATSITPTSNPVNAGAALSFAVTYTNAGPNTAAGYSQTLQLTAGLGAGNVSFTGLPTGVTAAYNNATGVVTFTGVPTTLASGANQNLTVSIANVPASLTQVVASTTVTTTSNQGADTGPNSATSTVTVTPVADVATSISASANPVAAGSPLTLTLTFTNNGPSTAAGYTRTVTLPAGLGTGVTVTGGTYNNATGQVTFTSPPTTLASGASADVTVTIPSVPASFATIPVSTSTSTTTSENGATANNNASLNVTVTPIADVATSITPSGNPVNAGAALSFAVTYTNAGPSTAAGYSQTLQLTAGLGAGNVSFTGLPTGVTAAYNNTTGVVTFTGVPTTLANGANQNLTVSIANVPASLTQVVASTTVSTSTSQGADTGPNSATSTVTVTPVADVATTLTGPASIAAGQPTGTFTASFTNNGPSTAANVVRTVTLPSGATLTTAQQNAITAQGGSISTSGGVTTLNFGTLATLASGGSSSFSFTYTAPVTTGSVATVSNTSTTTSENGATANNTATVNSTVTPVADVTTTLSGPTALTAGQASGTYTATFSNNGPSAAANVAQTVQLPAGSTLTTAQLNAITAQGGSYNSGTNAISFGTAATLANGATNTFTFSFTVPNQSGASVAIVSNVSTTTSQGPDTAPNSATVNATIAPVADVTTTLSGPTQLNAGQPATFSVTFANEGPTAASSVTRVVTLPTGATLTAAQIAALPAGATYTSGTNTINFGTLATLASGASTTLSFSFTAPTTTGAATLSSNTTTTSSEGPNLAPNTATLPLTVNATADVAISLTPGAATVVSGQPASFTVTFSNNGTQAAASTTASVQLPAGLTGVTVSNGGVYNSSTGVVTYPTGSLAAGATVSSVISFTAPASGSVTGVGSISTTTTEAGQTANNTASATISITPGFDLSTTLSGPASAQPGNLVTLNVTTSNNSGQAALNAVQTVQLAAGLSNVFVSNGGSYNSSTGRVTFPALASLAAGQTVANTISFAAPATAFAPVATVTPNTAAAGDSNPANNTAFLNGAASATNLTIQAASANTANIGTSITASAATVNAGATVTLTVVASNAGPNAATGVAETVQLLPGLSGVTVSNGGTYNSTTGVVTFPTIASLASGASQTYTIAFTAPANAGNNGQILATASIHSNTGDPVAGDNVDAVVVTVRPTADLAATISGPATAVAGQVLTYATTFSNNGPSAANGVVATTQLPVGLSGVTVRDNTGAIVAGAYNATTGLVSYPTLASAGAGTSQSFTISFTAPASGSLAVVSSVRSNTPDANPANNTASTTTALTPSADLNVVLSGPATAVIGNAVTYAVTTSNNGPSAAASVAPTLQLPAGLTILSLPAGASYDSSTGLVTFATVASLPSGASQTSAVTFVMPNPAAGQITATASASTTTADPTPGNNTQALQTSVAPATTAQANIATTLTPSAASVAPGATLTLTATFSNAGPAAAQNVAPVAYLPAGLTGVVVSNGGSYNPATGVVTWPVIASQASGSTATYTVQLTAPANGPLLASSATSSATSDPSGGNNVASTSVTIAPSYDEVTALSGPATAPPGASITYTVQTINNGPSNTPSATQTVTLPTGVVAANISGGGTQTGNTITFPAITNQAPGANGTVVNTFTVTMPASGSLSLTASVTAAGESNTGNNTATLTTSPYNQAPVANNVVNALQSPIGNTAVATLISPLSATDANGTVVSYTIQSLPPASQGVLFVNGVVLNTTNFPGLVLSPAQAAQLQFDPAATFVGNATFTYTATDNQGAVSNVALYTIPVGNDTPAEYTLLPPSGGQGNPYPNGSTLASVVDVNGATYNSTGTLTNNGIISAVLNAGTLPAGTALNPITGEITVTQANQLVPGTYPLTITTTDVFGGVTVHTITLVIGASPIAVDDYASTLPGVAVTFSVTGNDLPNGGPNIQASTLDLNPGVPGIQTTVTTAQGTWTTAGSAAGSITFTPAAGFTGIATLPYIVQNTAGAFTNQANIVVTVAPAAPANLGTSISASANPVNAGATETLTIVATNSSATSASGVVQTVSIPAGLTPATLTVGGQTGTLSGNTITFPSGATYNTSTGLVTFATITLAASASQTFTVAFTVPASGPFTATAVIGNGTADPNPANNTASVVINVNPRFDLSTAIAGPTSVVNGNLATFTVLTSNSGPSTATAAVQTVQLPTGLSGVFASNGGSYSSSTGVVTFPAVVLTSGQTVNNTVSFSAPASTFTASATVTPNTNAAGDTNPANNTATAPATSILPTTGTPATSTLPLSGTVANTYVSISGPTSALPGQAGLTYTITQGNDGPSAASNVQTQVSLPAGLSGVTVSNGGSYNSSTGIVTFPTIASQVSGTSQTYTVTLTAPTTGSTVMAAASTTAATTDPMAGNNVATVVTNLNQVTDVTASLSGPASVVAGQPVAYTVTLRNISNTPASTVVGTVQLVAGLSASDLRLGGLTGTLSGNLIAFAGGATYNTNTGVLTLAAIATLDPNAAQSFAITFPAPAVASLSASASVRTTTPETNLANNASGTTTTTVSPAADVAVQVSGPATATAGNLVTYNVTTSNNGPSPAASVTTTVQLPTGLSNVTVRDNTGTVVPGAYNASTGVVTFPTASNLPVGVASQLSGTVSFESPNAVQVHVTAVAAVSNATGDFALANNTATVVTNLNPAQGSVVDLQATLTANVATQAAGQPVTFTLTTTNLSPITAENVTQNVVLPANLTVASLQVNGGSGTLSGNTITFANASYNVSTGVLSINAASSLAQNASLSNTITLLAPNSSTLVATATVRADNPEDVLSNNVAVAAVAISTQADVATTVSGPATTVAGATVTYAAVTVNNGPANATGVVSTMTLPAGATNVVLPAGATLTGSVVTFATLSTLLPGSANAVTNTVSFTAPAPAYTVSSTVTTTSTDPNAANNSSSFSTTLANQAPVALNVVNTLQSPEGNTAVALPISPLQATDADGSIVSYTILSLPPASQGVLFVNGVALNTTNFPGLLLTPAQAAQLQFDPAAGYVGTVTFSYTATDNGNGVPANALTSNVAQYALAVGQDNASVYTNTPQQGGGTPYTNGYAISNAFDTNGGSYSSLGAVAVNGLASAVLAPGSNPLPAGVSLNPTTGQIFVSNASVLQSGTYTVTITTTDVFGGITTQPVTFSIGPNPLPVELAVFTAQAVNTVDAKLQWTTASERNNDRFEVERSGNGRDFVKVASVQGQGNTSRPSDYTHTDAGIGRQVSGLVYYRLKQVDLDGSFSYSPVRTVSFTKAVVPAISLYPNPATSETKLDLSQLPAGSYQVRVLDATGRVILGLQLEAGLQHGLDLTKVASGTYTLLVRGSNAGQTVNLTKRLIKE